MTLSIHLTLDWSYERVSKYGRDITAAIHKLVERYPNDLSVKDIAGDMMTGKSQLWLILDEEERFVAFVTSEIKINPDNGRKTIMLSELAGDGGADLVSLIGPIEDWARSIGAEELTPLGRDGWRKPLAKAGYRPKFVLFSKDLTNG